MGKRGRAGQKKAQGPKVKKAKAQAKAKVKAKAKARKTHNKAVKTNLKKMSFDNVKKIDLLNADVTKVYTGPPKPAKSKATASQTVVRRKSTDEEMPDVSGVADVLAKM